MERIYEREFDAGVLIDRYPPVWHCDRKKLVYEIACSTKYPFEGKIRCVRWATADLPEKVSASRSHDIKEGFFDYKKDSAGVHWYMNFGDPNIFVAYGSELLAQDELQVAEHPILGSIREITVKENLPVDPVDETGDDPKPTPVTITNVQRRCAIDTFPYPEDGLPYGLYGNNFASASSSQIKKHVSVIDPPTISNILVMSAVEEGSGTYSKDEIEYILKSAYTGFSAV